MSMMFGDDWDLEYEEEGEGDKHGVHFRRMPTEEEIVELKEVFDLIDTDGSGDISKDELGALMRILGFNPTELELEEMMEEVDEDDSHSIDVDEFIKVLTSQDVEVECTPHEFQEACESFVERDDFVEPETIKSKVLLEALQTFKIGTGGQILKSKRVEEIVSVLDSHHNGRVNFGSIVSMMKNQ